VRRGTEGGEIFVNRESREEKGISKEFAAEKKGAFTFLKMEGKGQKGTFFQNTGEKKEVTPSESCAEGKEESQFFPDQKRRKKVRERKGEKLRWKGK